MTKKEFYEKALLQISGNSAFGNGRGSYVDYGSWAEKIHEAANALLFIAQKHITFDKPSKPPQSVKRKESENGGYI